MFNRAGAAACAAAIAGMLLVPVPLSARGGAGAMGHSGGFRPVHRIHAPFVRPVRRVAPFAHHHRAPFLHRDFHDRHGFHSAAEHRHRRAIFTVPLFGYAVPVTYADDSAFYGSYYDPSDLAGSIFVPPYAVPPVRVLPVAGLPDPPPERVGCRSQTVAVPSPSGAERSVTITRC